MEYVKEGDFFVLTCEGEKIGKPLESLAVVFDKESGTLHKHGCPELAKQWFDSARKKFMDAGFADMASSLILLEGVFDVQAVNRMISTSGYAKVFYRKLTERSSALMQVQEQIERATRHAALGSGQSDVLYSRRLQPLLQSILDKAPEEIRADVLDAVVDAGFFVDGFPERFEDGVCSLTGIEEYCCQCGRHE